MLDNSIGRRLDSADSDFEKGYLKALYESKEQRQQRRLLLVLLAVKHVLRGLLFSWPLYLLALAAFAIPGQYSWLLGLTIVPAVWLSARILNSGFNEDRKEYLDSVVLKPGALKRILFPQ